VRTWTQDARRAEKDALKARAWSRWLDCLSEREVAAELDVPQKTVDDWLSEKRKSSDFAQAPGATAKEPWGVVQHGDVWRFAADSDPSGFFGKLPDQVVDPVETPRVEGSPRGCGGRSPPSSPAGNARLECLPARMWRNW
jgi:hypothetical protein